MKITVTSLFVQDQEKALTFYTKTLGFIKKHDVPAGEFRWITLASPEDQDGTELLLEPNNHPANVSVPHCFTVLKQWGTDTFLRGCKSLLKKQILSSLEKQYEL